MTPPTIARSLAVLSVIGSASPARAYTLETLVTDGCHESITAQALRSARTGADASRAIAPRAIPDDFAPLVADLPFHLPDGTRDHDGASLIVAVRENDLKGRAPTELDQLALVHGDPNEQREHCLRNVEDDGDVGSVAALKRCRDFVRAEALAAIDAFDAGPTFATATLPIALDVRGHVDVVLPAWTVSAARGLHALEDSFTHALRTADGMKVVSIMNWVELLGDYQEPRDGPAHISDLDRCDDRDALRALRKRLATTSAAALLSAIVASGPRANRVARVETVLDTYLVHADLTALGCSAQNRWCNAPELSINDGRGCAVESAASDASAQLALTMSAVALASALRRRRARRPSAQGPVVALGVRGALVVVAALSLTASVAHAAPATVSPGFGVRVAAGGSFDRAGFAASIAGRYRFDGAWLAGVDVEWNPWIAVESHTVRTGALNVYATLLRRQQLPLERFDLRTTVHLGTSTELFALYGVPRGSTGIYVGASFLGIEFKVGDHARIVLDPAEVALPIPQLRGAPFGYLQYRLTLALEYGT